MKQCEADSPAVLHFLWGDAFTGATVENGACDSPATVKTHGFNLCERHADLMEQFFKEREEQGHRINYED